MSRVVRCWEASQATARVPSQRRSRPAAELHQRAVMDGAKTARRWWGAGAEARPHQARRRPGHARTVYERFLDPRDEATTFDRWDEAAALRHTGPPLYATEEPSCTPSPLNGRPDASPERRAELRTEAGRAARHNVAFLDVTFSVRSR
ncbi:hypothetical protein HBB16_17440 [Pseudonocardia sp. MCCB 268]|nr:hypothetical protein [Pseudonocardia cytotoxica]